MSSFRFSTRDLPEHARARAIHALRERGIVPLEPLRGHTPRVHLTKWLLPGIGVLAGTFCGLRQATSARGGLEAHDDLFLGLNLTGESPARQGAREVIITAGDAALLSDAAGPFAIVRPTPVRFIGLRLPRRTLAPLVRNLDGPALRLVPRDTVGLKLLASYLGVLTDGSALASPEVAGLVAAHLHDLIALSVGATSDAAAVAEERGVRAARLRAIKSDIVAHLEDDSLTVSTVAARHGVSPRYVHKLFETDGTTFTQFVLLERLDRAYRLLRDSRLAGQRISSIAYDVGFGDLSYFNRAFRRRYDATPSDIRNRRAVT